VALARTLSQNHKDTDGAAYIPDLLRLIFQLN